MIALLKSYSGRSTIYYPFTAATTSSFEIKRFAAKKNCRTDRKTPWYILKSGKYIGCWNIVFELLQFPIFVGSCISIFFLILQSRPGLRKIFFYRVQKMCVASNRYNLFNLIKWENSFCIPWFDWYYFSLSLW